MFGLSKIGTWLIGAAAFVGGLIFLYLGIKQSGRNELKNEQNADTLDNIEKQNQIRDKNAKEDGKDEGW